MSKKKFKPLDLEEIKWILDELADLYNIPEKRILLDFKEIKQRIKEACMFYLKYRNNPFTFFNEFPEKFELFKKESGTNFMPETHYEMLKYNKWLFKLVFKSVF